ncbi:hypothetical protein [Micromonospora parathelypteridis]|uniref:Uncharacterized protein n=1 Tax=Micromonospora parathelypteridis TaxID=1839617 RepID=A0A840VV04_9ACTN|nr:hypothetical protein [Micromonospora parathelypteridis]MBB5481143.1 hypothetical protein [Micromonospora parathelypteridis]GGO19883.1 hypothetical protein GCM10011576_36550 [Micromonospora parathelypteridis]
MELPTGYVTALDAMNRHINSARPDAPVQAERDRRALLTPTRQAAAVALRRLADRIQPRPLPVAPRCS